MDKCPLFQIKLDKSPKNICNKVANDNKKLVSNLFETLKNRKMSVPEFSELSGIPKDRIYKWKQKGTYPKAEDEKVIYKWINGEKLDESPNNVQEMEMRYSTSQKPVDTSQSDILAKLTQSNLNLSEANKSQSKANEQQTANEARLIALLEKAEGVQKESPSIVLSMIPGLLEAMAEIASGTRYHSVEEAKAILGKKLGLLNPLKHT